MTDKPQEIEITALPPHQLKVLHDQLDQEIEILGTSLQSLKDAQLQFVTSKDSLKAIRPDRVGKEIMVPMSSSLYVPGQLADGDKVLVDIGTNYFVEKSVSDADEFLKRKIDYLTQQMEKLQPVIQQKYQTKQIILEVLQSKIMAQAKQQEQNR